MKQRKAKKRQSALDLTTGIMPSKSDSELSTLPMYSPPNNQTAPLNIILKRGSIKKSKPSTSGQNHFENEIDAGLKTCKRIKISPNHVPNRVLNRLSSRNIRKCLSYKPLTEIKDDKIVTSAQKTQKMLCCKQAEKDSKPSVSKGRNPKKAVNSSSSYLTHVVKTEVQAGEPQLRRSKRDKIPPLESWRNECRLFRCVAGQIETVGIDKGTRADTSAIDRVLKRMSKAQESKSQPKKKSKLLDNAANSKQRLNDIKPVATINPSTGEEEFMYLHRPYSTLLWSVPSSQDNSDPSYTITKCITSENISFGYLAIGVSKKKEKQYSPMDNITFNVIKGEVRMCINKENFRLKELDTILVPAGNIYSIHNRGKIEAVLSFCNFKTPLFDYQSSKDSN